MTATEVDAGPPPVAGSSGAGRRLLPQLAPLLPFALLFAVAAVVAYQNFHTKLSGDFEAHLEYLTWIDHHHWIPTADQGFEMYHPPVYYAATVVLAHVVGVFHPVSLVVAGRLSATLAWFLEGVVGAAIVRRMGGRWFAISVTAAVIWLLPGQGNVGARIYPETTAGLGVGLLVLGIASLAKDQRIGLLWLGLGVPIAGLSKFSGLPAVAVAVPVALWALARWRRQVLIAAAPGAALLAAFYGRNVLRFGTPTPLNANLFHLSARGGTLAHYPSGFFTHLSLGTCAAEHSFYGSVWKWFWATDCGVGKPPWRNTVGGWLLVAAVVTTLLGVAAGVWALSHGRRNPPLFAAAAIPLATVAAFVWYNVQVPSGSTGLYLLAAVVPAAVVLGMLADRVAARRWRWPGYGLLMIWALIMASASGVF